MVTGCTACYDQIGYIVHVRGDTYMYRIAGFFAGENFIAILHFCGDSRKFSPRKSIFKRFAKVFSRERNPLYGIKYSKYIRTYV